MNMDGFMLKALTADLNRALSGERIDKIHQPTSHHLTIHIGKRRLVISVLPHNTYVILDGPKLANPLSPPFFCLMLRKHLTNARITEVRMSDFERIVVFSCEGRDELGEPARHSLVAELTGRHSNVVLLGGDEVVVDSMRRVPLGDGVRPLFPGLRYESPPQQGKLSPRGLTAEDLRNLSRLDTPGRSLAEFLAGNVQGMSILLSREIASQLNGNATVATASSADWECLARHINSLSALAESGDVNVLYLSGAGLSPKPHIIPLNHLGSSIVSPGVNETLAGVILRQDADRQESELRQKLHQTTKAHIKKTAKLLSALQEDITEAAGKEANKRYGELLYANLGSYEIKGDRAIVTDYFDESLARVEVPVDPKRSMADNARRFFRQYEKDVGKEKHSLARLEEARHTLAYLKGLEVAITQAEDAETLLEIEREMISQGIRSTGGKPAANKSAGKAPEPAETRPREFLSPDGMRVLVGRNNLQNDRLVKGAKPDDLWFHVQKAPGSHCLVEVRSPVPDSTIEFAASLAAYYSSLRDSTHVPVDYTEKRHVRRPQGAKPGFVTYEKQRTVVINMSQVIPPQR